MYQHLQKMKAAIHYENVTDMKVKYVFDIFFKVNHSNGNNCIKQNACNESAKQANRGKSM